MYVYGFNIKVCRTFGALANETCVWKYSRNAQQAYSHGSTEAPLQGATKYPQLRTIEASTYRSAPLIRGLTNVLASCAHLENIHLHSCSASIDTLLRVLNSARLTSLSFTSCTFELMSDAGAPFDWSQVYASALAYLERLSFLSCYITKPADLAILRGLHRATKLTCFTLRNCIFGPMHSTDDASLVLHWPALEYLHVVGPLATPALLHTVSQHCQRLKHLLLAHSGLVTESESFEQETMQGVNLVLDRCLQLQSLDVPRIGGISIARRHTSMRRLVSSHDSTLNDSSLARLIPMFPNLHYLSLHGSRVTTAGMHRTASTRQL
jgi:hypothetical protein